MARRAVAPKYPTSAHLEAMRAQREKPMTWLDWVLGWGGMLIMAGLIIAALAFYVYAQHHTPGLTNPGGPGL